MRIRHAKSLVYAGFVALAAVHCGGSNSGEGAMTPAAGAQDPRPMNLTDPQVAAVIAAADAAALGQAQLAQYKSKSPKVLSFAATMISHYGQAQQKQAELELRAEASPTWKSLSARAQQTFEALKEKSGEAFDRAYLEAQVEQHQNVLSKIDEQLLPSAEDPELRSHLQEMKPIIALHLQAAQGALQNLNASK